MTIALLSVLYFEKYGAVVASGNFLQYGAAFNFRYE